MLPETIMSLTLFMQELAHLALYITFMTCGRANTGRVPLVLYLNEEVRKDEEEQETAQRLVAITASSRK